MKKSFLYMLFYISLFIILPQFCFAQIYNEDYSKMQKVNLFKNNRVWMTYGWTFLYLNGKQERKGKKVSFERFDRNGNRTEETFYDKKGNAAYSCQYQYDDNGQQIKKMGGVGEEVIYEQWYYTSNNNGMVVEKKSEFKKSKKEKWVYIYNAWNNISLETYYDINGVMSYKREFLYDDKQNIISKKEYDPYGNIYQKWVYLYDEKGNNIEMEHYISNNQLDKTYKMTYDKKGNMKSKFTFDKDENILSLAVYVYQFYDGLHAPRMVGNKN